MFSVCFRFCPVPKEKEEDINDARLMCFFSGVGCATVIGTSIGTGGFGFLAAPTTCGGALYSCTWGIDRLKKRRDKIIKKIIETKKNTSGDGGAGNGTQPPPGLSEGDSSGGGDYAPVNPVLECTPTRSWACSRGNPSCESQDFIKCE